MYQNWFLDYASYVILERAVPHINDGLKPVQRRILHSLKEMNDGRFHKVANVIGHTMKYHPHGDASIGDAMVQLGQKDLLLDMQGNWGNVATGQNVGSIQTKPGQSIAADVAGFYNKPIRVANQDVNLAIGGNISNIGSKISYTETQVRDFIPINFRLGTSVSTDIDDYNNISLAFDLNKLQELIDVPVILFQECIEEGMSEEEAIEETYNRFFDM